MSVKISPTVPPAHRKALKDFIKNPFVAARLVAGDFDHLLPPEVKEQVLKDREKDPGLVLIARERIERGIKEGIEGLKPNSGWFSRREEIKKEDEARKVARKAKYE